MRGTRPSPRIALVDFETGHFGDPAFDLGFFLSHLLLKTIRNVAIVDQFIEMVRRFWNAYRETLTRPSQDGAALLPVPLQLAPFEQRIVPHLAACMRARVDGKSTVDYLTREAQALVREVTRDWLLSPPDRVETALADLRLRLKSACSC